MKNFTIVRSLVAARCLPKVSGRLFHSSPTAWQIKKTETETYQQSRLSNLKEIATCYPHKFSVSVSPSQFIQKYSHIRKNEAETTVHVFESVAGRIHSIRQASKNLWFIDIRSQEAKLQVKASFQAYGDKDHFRNAVQQLRRGDIIGVKGHPERTKSGELSIVPSSVQLLAPCLRKLPSFDTSLDDHNKRFRNRHIDFLVNTEKRKIFRTRAAIISALRKFLVDRDFLEVETPILGTSSGGANALPFETYLNELALPMQLRVAPELNLKRLVIGGFDRVFEIGKQFRNEGVDLTHNPEFTSCEFYMAYADYVDLKELTQELVKNVVQSALGGEGLVNYVMKSGEEVTLDFSSPFRSMDFIGSLESATGRTFPEDLESEDATAFLSDLCSLNDVRMTPPFTNPRFLDKLFDHFVSGELVQPTFVSDHPQCLSPLAKPHRTRPGLSERFELFAAGHELCNAYTELNDPAVQRAMFSKQAEQRNNYGDNEAMENDDDFCRALEYGLPPTAGWGLGMDRLVMLLTNQQSIREVLLFPTMKPRTLQQEKAEYEKTI